MNKIYKYKVEWQNDHDAWFSVPIGSRVINFDFQCSILYAWVIVDTDSKETETVEFEVYGTGWEIKNPDELTHLKTINSGGHVWHVFKRNK